MFEKIKNHPKDKNVFGVRTQGKPCEKSLSVFHFQFSIFLSRTVPPERLTYLYSTDATNSAFCIIITHGLEESLLRCYDEIIVIQGGRISEQGKFDALMEKKGYFYSLYNVFQN